MQSSQLFNLITDLDEIPAKETEMSSCYSRITSFFSTTHLNEQEITDQLISDASKSADYHNQIILGLFYGILTENSEETAQKYSQWIGIVTVDSHQFLQWSISQFLRDFYHILNGNVKSRLFWIFSSLFRAQ